MVQYPIYAEAVMHAATGLPSPAGFVQFEATDEHTCKIALNFTGLGPGSHGLAIHEGQCQSNRCGDIGGHFNPFGKSHGGIDSADRHAGDLGNITANDDGSINGEIFNNIIKLFGHKACVIGKTIAVHAKSDDLGKGGNRQSLIDGNSGRAIVCGIISRCDYYD